MDVFLRLFTGLIIVGIAVVRCVKSVVFCCRKSERVPGITNNLLRVSATELAEKIRRKEISSYNLVLAYVNRIREVNPVINAVAEERFEAALEDARNVDAFLAQEPNEEEIKTKKPLLGIPVSIKENLSLSGMSSTLACKKRVGMKAAEDGEAVRRLKEAGAIPLLVSTTPEYCICIETYNKVFGLTKNPYNTLRTCGGSSGGEGALLGAGGSLIGLGSDLAGSIRYPSAFNGVFGHKPTHGHVSLEGHLPVSKCQNFLKCLALGPMVRYAEDIPLLMRILTDNSKKLQLDEKVDFSSITVFYMEDCGKTFGTRSVQGEIRAAIRECAQHLQNKSGMQLSSTKFDNMGYALEICNAVSADMVFETPLRTAEESYSTFGQFFINIFNLSDFSQYIMIQDIIDMTTKLTPRSKLKFYNDKLEDLKEEMSRALGDNGVFLFPAFPTTAPRHREYLNGYTGVMYSFIVNILGYPSTTVPVGTDGEGLPIGIQIIANINQDRLCMAVAKELETAFGGWIPPA